MARITFKGKIETVYNRDGAVAYCTVRVPKFERRHCDMDAFRRHPKFGGLANSTLFENVLARVRRDVLTGYDCLRLDRIPEHVTVDESGFLAVVTIDT